MKILFILIVLSSLIFHSSAYIYDDRLKSLQSQINDVKIKVDNLFKACKTQTNSSENNDYKRIESSFLQNNVSAEIQQNNTSNSSISTFFKDLKAKVKDFFHIKNDSKNKEAVKIKRCLSRTVGRNVEELESNMSNDEQLKQLLMKFFKCLSIHNSKIFNETTSEEQTLFDSTDIPITTSSPEEDLTDENNFNPRTEAYLRYLASSKHPVEEVGRPKHSKPDLKKTQEIIDSAKSSMWMNFEVDYDVTTKSSTTTEEYENVPELPILKRDTDSTEEIQSVNKEKRNGLFKGIITSDSEFQYEVPNVSLNLEASTSRSNTEELGGIEEVNKLAQKIDFKQQEDLMKFLDQLNEKPKEFKFNVDKYFMLAFENLTRIGEESKDDNGSNTSIGPRKYFEFDSGRKRRRNIKDQKIERLKEKFVNQYKDHRHTGHEDFKKIVEHIHDNHVDNSFLDKTFRLNDGSIKTSELIKPMHIMNMIKSPKEVKMDIELGEKIKEIEEEDFHSNVEEKKKFDTENDVPFYKTEMKSTINDIQELFP